VAEIDWYYHRKGCKTCARSDAFLDQHRVRVRQQVDCKKAPITSDGALELLDEVCQVFAVRGSAVRKWDSPFDAAEVLSAVIGPTGNLRAPSLLQKGRLFVGFDEGLYLALTAP